MSNKLSLLNRSIKSARTVKIAKNSTITYEFKLYPFGERGTFIEPALTEEITEHLAAGISGQFPEFDYIVSPEPGGHTWGMLAAYRLRKPINILRLSTDLYEDFQICVRRETAYNENYICFDGFRQGDRVLLVDDVISSGATIRSIVEQMRRMDITPVGVQAILAKGAHYLQLEQDMNIPVRVLSNV